MPAPTKPEICEAKAEREPTPDLQSQMLATQQRMGQRFSPNQILGRLSTIGCVAVEITQKCNLDCTLCYLSEHSQQVADVPIEEIFRRLDQIIVHYGRGTHVQITGGDPTLRKHTELVQIVDYAASLGLRPALFTNGIGASRKLLTQLADVGLCDVAFHVDTTQRRKRDGKEISLETELNDLREEYLDRCRDLGLMVIFNTTVHKDNFSQIPNLVAFFRQRADQIGLVSFQLQADTGRGEWRARDVVINKQSVCSQIELGSKADLPWDVVQVGHSECHSYMPSLVINNTVYPVISDKRLFTDFLRDFKHVNWSRQQGTWGIAIGFAAAIIKRPSWFIRILRYAADFARRAFKDFFIARGRAHKLTIFVQNFMDANELDQERVDACSFMVMTDQGPVSMCQHNAQRDDYILRPLQITRADGSTLNYKPINIDIAVGK